MRWRACRTPGSAPTRWPGGPISSASYPTVWRRPERLPRRPNVPGRSAFQYAILRVVPRVERGECMNVGVVVFCPEQRFIGIRIELDEGRLRAFAPDLRPDTVQPA